MSLGIDASNFSAGQKRMVADLRTVENESTRTAKSMQASGKQAAEYFSSIKTEVLSLLGVFLGGKGIETFIRDTTRSLADFGRTVGQLGSSGQQVQAFELAIARMGGSIESAHGSLLGLAKAKQDFITLGAGAQSFQFMSIMGATPNMTPLEIMEHFAGYIKRTVNLPGGESQIRQIGEGSGIDMSTILAMIQIGKTSNLDAEMRRSFELGAVASKDLIEGSTKFQTAVASFEQAVQGFSNSFLGKTITSLTSAIDGLTEYLIHPPQAPTPEDIAKKLETSSTFDTSGAFTFGQEPGWIGRWWREHFSGGGSAAGLDNATRARANDVTQGLITRGMHPDDAVAWAANAVAESGAQPGRMENNGGPGRGLFQITSADRKANYQRLYGHSPEQGSMDEQLNFVMWELANTERGSAFRIAGAKTPEDKAAAISQFNLRPRDVEGEKAHRAAIAHDLLNNPRPSAHRAIDPALTPRRMLTREDMMAPGPRADGSNTSISIGAVNVHAPGGDPHVIAKEINRALTDEVNAQSNRGLR